MGTRVSVSVHPDPETFRLVEFPDSEAGPFVSLRLGDVALLVSDPAVLTSLITLAGQGEAWLIAAATDHPGGPESAPELDLLTMPVGVA